MRNWVRGCDRTKTARFGRSVSTATSLHTGELRRGSVHFRTRRAGTMVAVRKIGEQRNQRQLASAMANCVRRFFSPFRRGLPQPIPRPAPSLASWIGESNPGSRPARLRLANLTPGYHLPSLRDSTTTAVYQHQRSNWFRDPRTAGWLFLLCGRRNKKRFLLGNRSAEQHSTESARRPFAPRMFTRRPAGPNLR